MAEARKRAASHCGLGQSRRSVYASTLRVQKAREQDHVIFDSCTSRLTVCSEVEQVPSSGQSDRTPDYTGQSSTWPLSLTQDSPQPVKPLRMTWLDTPSA